VRALDTETRQLGEPVPIEGETTLGVDPTTGMVWVAGNGAVTILE
jgi:topoisomerase IA-like protein